MEYHGKLYGKIGNKYFDTAKTSEDFDKLESQNKQLQKELDEANWFISNLQNNIKNMFGIKSITFASKAELKKLNNLTNP